MPRNVLLGLLLVSLAACATPRPALSPSARAADAAAITQLLKAQDAAWNAGDLEGFMNGYWVSDELRFASGGDIVRGYDETLARYRLRYPGLQGMGTLSTSDYEIDILSPDAAIAHGRWQVARESEVLSGLYTLVLRKRDGAWVIVSDTTTSAE